MNDFLKYNFATESDFVLHYVSKARKAESCAAIPSFKQWRISEVNSETYYFPLR